MLLLCFSLLKAAPTTHFFEILLVALDDGDRAGESLLREQGGEDPVRGGGALPQILLVAGIPLAVLPSHDKTVGPTKADGIRHLFRIQPQQFACRDCRRETAGRVLFEARPAKRVCQPRLHLIRQDCGKN